MKPLIAIVTCGKPEFVLRAQAQRNTWVPYAGDFDVRFFYGRDKEGKYWALGDSQRWDEVHLDVPDDYEDLPAKVQAVTRWALLFGYERMFKTDDDTYIVPSRLHEICPFPPHTYVGCMRRPTGQAPSPYSSGFAYWLCKPAMETIAFAPLTGDTNEDRWVGNTLTAAGIQPMNDSYNYRWLSNTFPPSMIWNRQSAIGHCAVFGEFTPQRMHETHTQFLKLHKTYRRRKPKLLVKPWLG